MPMIYVAYAVLGAFAGFGAFFVGFLVGYHGRPTSRPGYLADRWRR